MKYIQTFESFEDSKAVFYSCVKEPILFNNFIEQEVYKNSKFTPEDILRWMEKYFLTLDDKVVWVSPDKDMCYRFNDTETQEIKHYTLSDGFIIPESDDSNNGFLMILRDCLSQN
jgi:hypothetical protein